MIDEQTNDVIKILWEDVKKLKELVTELQKQMYELKSQESKE